MAERRGDSYKPRVLEIRRLRLAREWTIETLADKADVPKRTVERICSGSPGSLRNFTKLAEAFGTTADKLFVDAVRSDDLLTGPLAFQMRLDVAGQLPSLNHTADLTEAAARSLEHLRSSGIPVHDSRLALAVAQSPIPAESGEHGTYILVGLAWSQFDKFSTLALVREDKYRAFFDAAVERTLTITSFDAYGRLFPPALQQGGPWPVIQAVRQPPHSLDQKHHPLTIVDMPQAFQYVRPSDFDKGIHTGSVLAYCNQIAEIGAREFQHDTWADDLTAVPAGTYICCGLSWRNSLGIEDAAVLIRAEKFNDFDRAVRSRTIDLDNFDDFGRIYPSDEQWPGQIWEYLKRDKPLPHGRDLGDRRYSLTVAWFYYVFPPAANDR
ncbi:MAG: XRE family transcriptional regulator [Cyanobacteria bacterium CYA]|nr:MAG: XRE family transcriptional regulator [Cyanobacteria bacterium CYA]